VRELLFALAAMVDADRKATPVEESTRIVLRPTAVDDLGFTVEPDPEGGFLVRGDKPERWVQQTDFNNDEAVGYLADRLNRLGVEKALADLGAEPGVEVTIGEVSFGWHPTLAEDFVSTTQGADIRLDDNSRVRASDRRYAKDLRRAERLGLDVTPDLAADLASEDTE
jgi:GTPase